MSDAAHSEERAEGRSSTTCSPPVRFKWKLRWFLQGMGSILGPVTTPEQTRREIAQCVDEIISKANAQGLPSAGGDRPKTEKGN